MTILVTGGSGFIAAHVIVQLLQAGHRVRTTIRNSARAEAVRAMVREGGADPSGLDFAAADLLADAGWAEAVAGCGFVHHVASPFPPGVPKDEDELILPAREGTLRVLRAARDAGVRRVVVTSSFAAVGYGHPPSKTRFDETDWTDPTGSDALPYIRSKTLAERAAWDFLEREGGGMELAVVNPVGVFGPVLGPDYSTSIALVERMLAGKIPASPHIFFGVVDVRDVADLHLRAMTAPEAKGERFLAVAGEPVAMADVGRLLRSRLGAAGRKAPRWQLPDWFVRLGAKGSSPLAAALKQASPQLGKRRAPSNEKAKRVLGWQPRSNEEAILATAESLLRLDLVKA
ncbi:MAG TPA: aldehyde reductase [Candidatus Methylacidiphilales bacterium]